MDSYKAFSYVYDELMDNLDYDEWFDYLNKLIKKYVPDAKSVVELGCGTGTMTKKLANAGYDVIGLDLSEDMLSVAMSENYDSNILYIKQDMTQIDLGSKHDVFVSVGDSVNYITDKEDLVKVFEGVKEHLKDDGAFIFDLKTKHLYESIGDSVIADNRDDMAMIWENSFKDNINEYLVTVFTEQEDGSFERFRELHRQRAYSIEEIEDAMSQVGMKCDFFEAFSDNKPSFDTERYYIVARLV